ncbi:hypothetical protein [Microbacterium sp. J1-1]|uniref:hypothetical protein n=1 Tax=Microbacterium sp. J1-1 TaxID=2992441 RepID=UPI0021140BAF|nr:hypothetical protein [Microbacterium sp. J1-1]UUE19339.1 hypothetical protein LRQ07_11010 [Microbacterium sp. J1-1]
MTTDTTKPTCFIAMPITVHEAEAKQYGDDRHWEHVMRHLFMPAIEKAGYVPILPNAAGTSMIHGRIVKHLSEASLVLCDLSQHNPNVLFELGVRTSLNKPVALVKDEYLKLPFDIQGLNTHPYASHLAPWSLDEEIDALAKHIIDSVTESHGANPLWAHFGVAISAAHPPVSDDPVDAKMQIILERMDGIENYVRGQGVMLATQTVPFQQYDEVTMALLRLEGVQRLGTTGDSDLLTVDTAEVVSPEAQLERANRMASSVAALGYPVSIEGYDSTQVRLAIAWGRREQGWRARYPS